MQADYVVVGAGSAGCTVAARLSETGASVILLEAGPSDWHPMIHIPAGIRSLIRNPLVTWNYTTEPEKGSGDRRIEWPRGRTLGGSSSINGMLYVRGAPADFDNWAQMGCRGWSYDDVLPYFMKSEQYVQGGDKGSVDFSLIAKLRQLVHDAANCTNQNKNEFPFESVGQDGTNASA